MTGHRHLAGTTLRLAQISLRFDVPPAHVGIYIARAVSQLQLDGFTSTEGKGRVRAVRKALGRGWRVQARGEYLTGTRKAVIGRWWFLPFARRRIVEGADWSNGPRAGTRHFAVMFSNHRIKATGQRLRLMVAHTPSHVQVGGHWRKLPARVRPHKLGMRQWGHWIAKPAPTVVQVASMDSNTEQHLEVWRDYLERELGLPSMWHDSRPGDGTLGARLVDTMHSNAAWSGQDVADLPRDHGLDHALAYGDLHPEHLIA